MKKKIEGERESAQNQEMGSLKSFFQPQSWPLTFKFQLTELRWEQISSLI